MATFARLFSRSSTSLALLSALLLSGCSNSPYPAAMEGGKVFIGGGGNPVSLDPSVSFLVSDSSILWLITPGFFRYKYFKREPYGLELNLGAAMPTMQRLTPRKKGDPVERWTYRLRKDLRFQDDPCFPGGKGRGVVAADVIYSFKRMIDTANESPLASYLAAKVVGWNDDAKRFDRDKKKAYDAGLIGVRVDPNDPYAFQIDLNQPYPQLKYIMAMTFATPQPREAVERYGDEYALHHPVGCGPYMLKDFVANDHIDLVRNPNAPAEIYPSEADPKLRSLVGDAGKRLPLLDEIYLPIMTESVTSYNLFQQGYLDTLGVGAGNAQMVPAVNGLTKEMQDRGVTMVRNVGVNVDYLAFNMEDPTYGGYTPARRKLRQAISLAISSQEYIDVVAAGLGRPAQWLLPPDIVGYDPGYKNPYRQFDPKLKQAKRLLAEAGYKDGIDPKTGEPLVLTFDNPYTSGAGRQIVRLYQRQIEALGIRVVLNSLDDATYGSRLTKKEAQFFSYGWVADYPDAEDFGLLLYGPNAAPGPNASLYDNPEYNKLFEEMRGMADGPERNAVVAKMRDLTVEDCPLIYIDHSEARTLRQPWVRNEDAHPMAYDGGKYLDVDPEMRTRLQKQWNRSSLWPVAGLVGLLGAVVTPAVGTVRMKSRRRLRRRG